MNAKIYELQSPEWEKTVMMHLVIKGDADRIAEFVEEGWGVYPEILNLLAVNADTKNIERVLKAAGKYERYDVDKLYAWLRNFFGEGWKDEVARYRLQKVAVQYFKAAECETAGFWEALHLQRGTEAKKILCAHFGMDYMLKYCDTLRAEAKVKIYSDFAQERLREWEEYLFFREQYDYLLKHECWKMLCNQRGLEYLAAQHDYHAILRCVTTGQPMTNELKQYVRSVLDYGKKDMSQTDLETYRSIRKGCLLLTT